jgi:hypothetical protein
MGPIHSIPDRRQLRSPNLTTTGSSNWRLWWSAPRPDKCRSIREPTSSILQETKSLELANLNPMTVDRYSSPLTFSFQLTKSEYCSLTHRALVSIPRQRRLLAFLLGLLVVGVIFLLTPARAFGAFLVETDCIWLVVAAIAAYVFPHVVWRRDSSLGSPRSVTISVAGVDSRTSLRTTSLEWRGIKSVIESASSIIMTVRGTPFVILLPKSAIASKEDLTAVRELIKNRMAS